MNRLFAELIDQHAPQVNKVIMDGLSCTYMKEVERYIDEVYRSASASFPPDLVYLGYERCTPLEEYEEVTKLKNNNKRSFDFARSDIYLVKYKFAYQGVSDKLTRYIFLPYVNDGGIFSLGGSKFHVTPVVSDKVISPGFDSVFVRLLRGKIIFKRCYHSFTVDGRRETSHVIWSEIYSKRKDAKKVSITTKASTTLPHYLFAKYGYSEVFRKFVGVVPIAVEGPVDTAVYPPDQYVVIESSKVKPKTFIGEYYNPSEIRLIVPRAAYDQNMKSLCVGFFYVVDHFPNRFKPEYLDNTSLWMILLGHIIFSGLFGENKLYTNIQEHFISLDDYVDTIVVKKLKESGYNINNFYDLLMLLMSNFNNLVLDNSNSSSSMYGKSLEVLYYVLYDLSIGIFKVVFKLAKLITKKPLSMNDIVEAFNKEMTPGAIFKLSSGKIITESVSYSGDHKYFKITSKVTEQESMPGATRGRSKRLSVGPDKHLDISMLEAGSILYLSKSNPSPTNRVNPFVHLDLATGTILQNPALLEVGQRTQALLKGMTLTNAVTDINATNEDL